MRFVFKRKNEIDLRAFRIQIDRQYEALEILLAGKADQEEVLSYVEDMLRDGRPCHRMPEALFWGYDEPENMPGDARVAYYYKPTFLNTAFLMQAYRMMPEKICDRVPDFAGQLGNAMTACAGRGFQGYGYDKRDFAEGMKIFASVRTKDFIRNHQGLVPVAFKEAYLAAFRSIERDVFHEKEYLERLERNWESNNLEAYREILALENEGRHTVFVYGSLMKGGYNHPGYMEEAQFLGDAYITGFDMYDLGYFPGIRYTEEPHKVLGELYDVSDAEFERICILEGNGSLYQCETVSAVLGREGDWQPAEVFVYLGKPNESDRLLGKEVAWKNTQKEGKQMKYVWYACYGSNINRERFMRYINNCSNTTPPVEDRPFEFTHPVFFAGKSSNWDDMGVAFLDAEREGHAYGRIYKITEEQYNEVKRMEGPSYRNKLELGELEGLPVVSFTCFTSPQPNTPSADYLKTILAGLQETYPAYRESAIAEEMFDSIFSREEIKLLDCLRKAEHGLTNREIRARTGMPGAEENKIISALLERNAIQQDSRYSSFSHDDERAVFFTSKKARETIDIVREGH